MGACMCVCVCVCMRESVCVCVFVRMSQCSGAQRTDHQFKKERDMKLLMEKQK